MGGKMKISLHTYPESVIAYPGKTIDLIIDIESSGENTIWLEAEIKAEAGISLQAGKNVQAGRFRLGFCEGRDSLSKSIKLYTEHNIRSHLYKCHVSVFAFNKKGDSIGRIDEHTLIKCTSK